MFDRLALLIALLCTSYVPGHATDFTVTWGVEQYSSCTNQQFSINLNSSTGRTYLKRIIGTAVGVPTGTGVNDTNTMRAALGTFFNMTVLRGTAHYATAGVAPPVPNNQSVVNAFGAFVLKQTGTQSVSTPIDFQYSTPVALPGNVLSLAFQVQSYPSPASTSECMDIEVQVLVIFSDTPS